MELSPKRKKLIYIPGIISLTIAPFVFIHFAQKNWQKIHLGTIKINWADLRLPTEHPEIFTSFRGHFPPERKYISIIFDANSENNKVKLGIAAQAIDELVSSNDTLKGVHFIFTDESHYGNFVKAVDICRLANARSYMPYENNLWVYNLPPIPKDTTNDIPLIFCGTPDATAIVKLNDTNTLPNKIISFWKASWEILLGFLALSTFSVRTTIKRIRNGRQHAV